MRTPNSPRRRDHAGRPRLVPMVALAALWACHGDAPPPLYTGVEPEEAAASVAVEAAPAPVSTRQLWFADGPGLEALMARERRDHATAIAKLDALLTDASLSADDRGVAELLRGLEDLEADRYAEGAEHLAKARGAAALAPLTVWLRTKEAQARLDAGQPEVALGLVRDIGPTGFLAETALVIEADALLRTDAPDRAQDRYEEYLRTFPAGARRHAVRLHLADLVVDRDTPKAARLLEQVMLDVPLSQHGRDAHDRMKALEKAGKLGSGGKAARDFQRRHELAQLHDRLARRDYARVVREADAFLRHKGLSSAQECEAMFVRASAVFKQRERSKARPLYDQAAKRCERAGSTDDVVKSRYQAARGRYAQGEYSGAARDFEKLAADHSRHSYADDSLIKAGEAWEEAGQADKARRAYARALEEPQRGDMADEARRRLLVQAFAESRFPDALALVDAALDAGVAHRRERAKLHYFRGRALAQMGKAADARAAWLTAVEQMPLSYPAVQSLSRLREESAEGFAQGVATLEREFARDVSLELPSAAGVERARLFARLGMGEEAKRELDDADVAGWPAAALLAQAGHYDEVQRKLANLGLEWRKAPPVGAQAQLWRIAHPTPFTEIIEPGEREYGVPPLLTFAIMQTESRFNPGVTSWAGARGLVQLMPATAKSVAQRAGVDLSGDEALYDPATNLGLGMRYLASLTRRWGGGDAGPALAIPSYNAGAGSVDKWVAERGKWPLDLFIESIPYDETRKYTQKVLERWAVYRWMYGDGDAAARLVYLPPDVPKRAE